jgi:nucleoid-associated protein YgaU
MMLAAGTSVAQAQTVVTHQIAGQPVETVEIVRTVESATTPLRRVVSRTRNRVTTTRTVVTERMVPAPVTPAVAAIAEPTYTEVVQAPPAAVAPAYPRLYDVVTPAPVAAPVAPFAAAPAIGTTTAMPTYRYVYEPDRILVIDPYTNIAVQAIPR